MPCCLEGGSKSSVCLGGCCWAQAPGLPGWLQTGAPDALSLRPWVAGLIRCQAPTSLVPLVWVEPCCCLPRTSQRLPGASAQVWGPGVLVLDPEPSARGSGRCQHRCRGCFQPCLFCCRL